jgi:hypothetical protein
MMAHFATLHRNGSNDRVTAQSGFGCEGEE